MPSPLLFHQVASGVRIHWQISEIANSILLSEYFYVNLLSTTTLQTSVSLVALGFAGNEYNRINA